MSYLQNVPEIILLIGACIVLLLGVYLPRARNFVHIVSLFILLAIFYINNAYSSAETLYFYNGFYVLDGLAVLAKSALCGLTFIALIYSKGFLDQHDFPSGEFHSLMLFALLGMFLISSSAHFLTVYLGLELLSLSLYALVAMRRDDSISAEAAIKYFVLGAIASGFLLYGISLFYGLSGTLFLNEIMSAVAGEIGIGLIAAIIFIIAGIAFKLGAVPFHMWMPDVYQGAPLPTTTLIASAAKIAGFMLAIRLLADGLQFAHQYWQQVLLILAIISLVAGNLIAIAQADFRRMLAYSTIGHVGYILLGLLVGSADGYAAALFYTMVYALSSSAVFGVLLLAERADMKITQLDDLRGLSQRSPWLALFMLVLMFSMAGIPLTIGFYAKLNILQVVLAHGAILAAVIAVMTSVIGAFYYLRVIKLMYFDDMQSETTGAIPSGQLILLGIHSSSIIVLFIYPQYLIVLCKSVFG
jgi:NADH-quinone oxidoreductase subunit N